jgi:LacI family transcriptional regulator
MKTIRDVAKLAGVSASTAGRVIGNYGSVSETARKKVLDAVQILNYHPNAIAQSMRNHSSKTIAVVIGSIMNNFFSEITYVIERIARRKGYNVLICNTHEKKNLEIQQLELLYSKHIDGIILASAFEEKKEIPERNLYLYGGEIPLVCIDRSIKGLDIDLIETEHFHGAYEATRYLIGLGHQKIAVIGSGNPATSTVKIRMSGYKKALEESRIEFNKNRLLSIDYEKEVAQKEISSFFDKNTDITAVLVLNNSLCSGILKELKKRNLSIPDDVSFIGWDDEALNQLLNITTEEQQIQKIGKLAAERIFYLIESPKARGEHMVTTLKPHLIIRDSCKKIVIDNRKVL